MTGIYRSVFRDWNSIGETGYGDIANVVGCFHLEGWLGGGEPAREMVGLEKLYFTLRRRKCFYGCYGINSDSSWDFNVFKNDKILYCATLFLETRTNAS